MEGSKFFAKVKTPRAKSGISESGGVTFSDARMDSSLHTDWDLLSAWVDKNMPDKDYFEKIDFIRKVQQDPDWEYEDLEFAWVREGDEWLTMAKNNPHYLENKGFAKIVDFYRGNYPGDEAYRKNLLERKRQKPTPKKKVKTEDKIMNGFLQQDNKYKMGK